jgi:hypothetical protein
MFVFQLDGIVTKMAALLSAMGKPRLSHVINNWQGAGCISIHLS